MYIRKVEPILPIKKYPPRWVPPREKCETVIKSKKYLTNTKKYSINNNNRFPSV